VSCEFIRFLNSTHNKKLAAYDIANTTEVSSYLADTDRSLTMLHKYPSVKSVFMQYNTTLLSSAAVKRLFSVGGQIETPRRNKLSDENFERLLLLKANMKYCQQ